MEELKDREKISRRERATGVARDVGELLAAGGLSTRKREREEELEQQEESVEPSGEAIGYA